MDLCARGKPEMTEHIIADCQKYLHFLVLSDQEMRHESLHA